MKVKDIMTWNVITVSSDTPIMEARKILETHKIRRIPVVDRGKLVGIVTLHRIDSAGPSEATSLSIWESNYLLARMKVKEIMQKDVVTIDPEASIEQALAKGQGMRVGIMPVIDDNKLVGVVTTTDFMLKMLTPALGIGRPGTRLNISECNQAKSIKELMEIVEKGGMRILSAHTMPPAEDTPNGFSLHVDSENVTDLIKSITAKGYKVTIVAR